MKSFNYCFDYTRRLLLFLLISIICLTLVALVTGIILKGGNENVRLLRVTTVVQDVVGFILPALATAVIVSGLPASMLGVDRGFKLSQLILAVAVMIASMPFMNFIIDWNAHISLPSWATEFEHGMQRAEQAAAESVKLMLSGPGLGATIVSILIVGVLAGFSEELYFRGVLQRLLASSGVNIHAAVWIGAVIFSAFHFQFYGFFPRVLLGAFFGYLLVWSGSIWLPAIIHALNNTIYVIAERHQLSENVNSFGLNDSWLMVGSVIVTVVLIMWLIRSSHGRRQC